MKNIFKIVDKYYKKYKELVNYAFFGVLTTLVNYIVYIVSSRFFRLDLTMSTIIAWVIAVLFAYITNRKYVFESKIVGFKGIIKEISSFFFFRVLSGIIDVVIMYVSVNLMGIYDLIMKLLSNVIVIIANYLFSKIFIFKEKKIKDDLDSTFFEIKQENKAAIFFMNVIKIVTLIAAVIILYLNFNIAAFILLTLIYLLMDVLIKHKKTTTFDKDKKSKNKVLSFLDNNYHYIILIIAFIIRIAMYFKLQIVPRSDFKAVLLAAQELLNGNNILNTDPYFIRWAYQTGMVLYDALVIGLLGSELWLHILDCVYGSIVCLFIYLIAKEIFGKRPAQIVSFLYCIGIYVSAFCGVLSNQHIFSVFILMAIYILVAKKYSNMNYILKYLLVGALIAFSNIFRTEAIVYVAVILVYIFINCLSKEKYKKGIVSMFLIIATYLIINNSASFLVKATGVNNNGLENKDVLWKFVCASDYNAKGGYSKEGTKILLNTEAEKEFIKKNLASLSVSEYIDFFEIKEREFWGNIPYYWVFYELENKNVEIFGKVYQFSDVLEGIQFYDVTIFLICIISATIFVMYNKKQGITDRRIYLLYLVILANFFVYLLIEVNARYSYIAKVFIYILAAGGINLFIKKNKNRCIKED